MKEINRQSGFTIIEGLLILIIAGLIGFAGWFVWQNKNQNKDNVYHPCISKQEAACKPQADNITTFDECKNDGKGKITKGYGQDECVFEGAVFLSPEKYKLTCMAENSRYLNIKEWGVHAPYPGSLRLCYKLGGTDGVVKTDFSSVQLGNAAKECIDSGGGWVQRLKGSEKVVLGLIDITAEDYVKKSPGPYAHIGKYFYIFHNDQFGCGGGGVIQKLQKRTTETTSALVPKLEAIPN